MISIDTIDINQIRFTDFYRLTTPGESHEGKINAKYVELFRNGSVQEFYRLKALIALEKVNTSVVDKKKNLR